MIDVFENLSRYNSKGFESSVMFYMKSVWTKNQIKYLIDNYETLKTQELLKVLTDKTNNQLRWKAKEFKLKKQVTCSKSDIRFLENFDDLESLYWWGFITADGCFNKNSLIIQLNNRDESHLKKFADKIKTNLTYRNRNNSFSGRPEKIVRISVNDKFIIPRLKEKLNIKPKKTYNPFDLSIFYSKERLIYFFCGLIDGDGSISCNSNARISIKVHPSWESNFRFISKGLKDFYNLDSTVKINNSNWLVLNIYGIGRIKSLYNMVKNKIPLLERKWSPLEDLHYKINRKLPVIAIE